MSDEEKKAIEYWKTHREILHWNTQLASEHYIKVLLNLIEKQSKEIEELKKGFKIQEHNYQVAMEEIEQRWTDKIKTKIEELEKEQEENKKDLYKAIDLLWNAEIDKISNKISVNLTIREILQLLLEKE